ncbi:MAG: sigma E protease regulator RseP [Gammaproteobacteria bacterium]|nr:sigma E protease regulator RseP [Gammaproteobacteria bacterium]
MSTVLLSVLWFIIAIGILVTVHEFGHYWVARRCGVKVLRFSIGFGKPLLSWRRGADQTEYVIAAIPLGGYVRMLDEREGEVAEHELDRAFNRKPVWARFAIVAAGPLSNLLLAILAFWLVFMLGIPGVKPLVGKIDAGSLAAQAGLHDGDMITRVGDEDVLSWRGVYTSLTEQSLALRPVNIGIRERDGRVLDKVLDFSAVGATLNREDLLNSIGIHPYRPLIPPVLDHVEAGSPAQRAGLRAADRILQADGQGIEDWEHWVSYVRARPGQAIQVTVERSGQIMAMSLTPDTHQVDGQPAGRIGASVRIPERVADNSLQVTERYGPFAALGAALDKTWAMSRLTLRMLFNMLFGDVPASSISGPISIAQYAGSSASAGVVSYCGFLALISISLAILNLLPIPVLDGGHLFFYLIEMVKGSPVSDHAQMLGQRIGIAILVALMGLAFYNDIARFFT